MEPARAQYIVMATNPLFPTDDDKPRPPSDLIDAANAQNAVDMMRQKVARVYGQEPDAKQELTEAGRTKRPSKHQQFMQALSESGKDLATIQTDWHNYYLGLPEDEKQQVWHEFYESQPLLTGQTGAAAGQADAQALAEHKHKAARPERASKPRQPRQKLRDARSTTEVQAAIRDKVSAGGQLQAKHHLQSLLFGLGIGAIVVIIFLFGFFNEVVIAPFIQPSRTEAATPLIVSNDVSPTAAPEVIIPKINVQIPVDYSQTSINESTIEDALQDGVVHYPTTAVPGQNGNAAYFGHSSNNIFNKGKYKFAFVLLHTLQNGDTFYLTYNGKVYAYKVISRTIVDPSDVGVLGPVPGQTATATLITCDPPGTSLHRLIVVGQQISPDPSANSQASTNSAGTATSTNLPGNGPTLLTRFMRTAIGKLIVAGVVIAALLVIGRWALTKTFG
ncbi:MAG TPA: class E sortase [Candidatus Saccharimonadales bacterium]|nr:class E sortase [Candidatus Saccharimonadales bacterium]